MLRIYPAESLATSTSITRAVGGHKMQRTFERQAAFCTSPPFGPRTRTCLDALAGAAAKFSKRLRLVAAARLSRRLVFILIVVAAGITRKQQSRAANGLLDSWSRSTGSAALHTWVADPIPLTHSPSPSRTPALTSTSTHASKHTRTHTRSRCCLNQHRRPLPGSCRPRALRMRRPLASIMQAPCTRSLTAPAGVNT